MSGVLPRWTVKLRGRQKLLQTAQARTAFWRARHRAAAEGTEQRSRAFHMLTAAKELLAKRREQVAEAERVVARHSASTEFGGSRAVTDEVIRIVDGRAPVTSRKRAANHPLSISNPGSDHSGANPLADAVDFGIAEAHGLKNEISRKLGGPAQLVDFGEFVTRRNGHRYRVQIIAGTHGTGPHLHVGVRKVA